MKPGGGKGKGADFEMRISRAFTAWWGQGKFVRTANMQCSSRDSRLAHGDVACLLGDKSPSLDHTFPFSIECKNDESFLFVHLFRKDTQPLLGWWNQAKRDAELWDKQPMLVFTKNWYPDFVMTHLRDTIIGDNSTFHRYLMLNGEHLVISLLQDWVVENGHYKEGRNVA